MDGLGDPGAADQHQFVVGGIVRGGYRPDDEAPERLGIIGSEFEGGFLGEVHCSKFWRSFGLNALLMKKLLKFLWCLLLISTMSQQLAAQQNLMPDLIGRWDVTEDDNELISADHWQFEKNGEFCELKYPEDGATELACDEHGVWEVDRNLLKLSFLGENGVLYGSPYVITFSMARDKGDFLITIFEDPGNFGFNMKTNTLRLSKIEDD